MKAPKMTMATDAVGTLTIDARGTATLVVDHPNVLDAQLTLERAIRRRLAALAAVRAASGSPLIAALDEHGEASMEQAHAYRALELALAHDEGVSL